MEGGSNLLVAMAEELTLQHFDTASTIIGFTGSIGSGCSTIARTLQETNGYKYYKLSSLIRDYADEKGSGKTRNELQSIGNELRKNNAPHYLAKKIMEKIDEDCQKDHSIKKVIIDSIRNDKEVMFLRQFPRFYLISVYADYETRFNRLSKINTGYSRADFNRDDIRDATESFPYGQQVEKCNYLSDIIINSGDSRDLSVPKIRETFVHEKLAKYLDVIENGPSSKVRPHTKEKIMTLAYMESLFSSCLQRKVGAVITTEDGIIISSGFNHVPPREKTCFEEYGECYRGYLKTEHSKKIKYCPSCGELINISCKTCNKKIEAASSVCPTCGEPVDYECPKCHERVFDVFTPGGKGSIGKLLDVCRALHAEENAILNVARVGGTSLKGMTLYTTTFPCTLCANKIAQVGIKRVIYSETYTMKEACEVLRASKIDIEKFEGVKSQAFFKLYGY
jgi:deoxycytidylate deaminase/dephospho-CoA kinase